MPYCSVKRRQNSHPKTDRGRGSSVRNGEVELTSRGRGSSIWTTSGRFSVKSKNDTPFATKRRPTKRPPKPDRPRPHLGRNRVIAYGPVCFPHSGVSGASASVRLMIQRHSARRVSSEFVRVISSLHSKSRRFNLTVIHSPPAAVRRQPGMSRTHRSRRTALMLL